MKSYFIRCEFYKLFIKLRRERDRYIFVSSSITVRNPRSSVRWRTKFWGLGINYYSCGVEARTLCTFIALPRFKFLYIGNGNKVFILGVSWYQSNAFTFRSSCEIVIERLSMKIIRHVAHRCLCPFRVDSKRPKKRKKIFYSPPFHFSLFPFLETTNERNLPRSVLSNIDPNRLLSLQPR